MSREARPSNVVMMSNNGNSVRRPTCAGVLSSAYEKLPALLLTTESQTSTFQVPEHSITAISARGPSEVPAREWTITQEKNYSVVDNDGLAGHPTNTVEWENENQVPVTNKRGKPKESRLVPREASKDMLRSASGSRLQSQVCAPTSSSMAQTGAMNHDCKPLSVSYAISASPPRDCSS